MKEKHIEYALWGLGATALGVIIFRSIRKASAKSIDANPRIPRGSRHATSLLIENSRVLANPQNNSIPAILIKYEPSENWDSEAEQDILNFYELNFTPRRASETPNEAEYADSMYLQDPNFVPSEFQGLRNPTQMIHPNDYQILQIEGLIPKGFPIERVSYTKSLNGKNEFVVGYSEPMRFKLKSGERVSAIKPLWAVSFGNGFNTNSTPPANLTSDFDEVAQRLIVGEGLHARANEGCDYRLNHNMCAAEKNAIFGILLERYKRRKERKPSLKNLKFNDIITKPQTWNSSKAFTSGYHGHPGTTTFSSLKHKLPISKFDSDWVKVYDDHKTFDMWHLPSYGRHATHFSHYDAQKGVPSFFLKPDPVMFGDEQDYAANHTIRIGRTLVRDQRKGYI